MPELKPEHVSILDHTLHRSPCGVFCGDSPAMQELVALGCMRSIGKADWCPDEFFRVTKAGVEAYNQAKEACHA